MKPRQVRSAAAQGRVLIKSSPALGTIAIANRSFDEGEVVLDEPPFLVIAKRDLSSFRRDGGEDGHTTTGDATEVSFAALAVTKGLPAGFFDALEAALSTLSTNEFKLLVEELYSPLAHQPGDSDAWLSDVLRPTVTEMEACQALFLRVDDNKATRDHKTLELLKDVFWPKTRTTSDVERAAFAVLRFLHGVRVNTHSDDKAGYSAVFIAASKFTHDCSPNTFWYLQRDESADGSAANLRASVRAVHVATRKINEGDMLTFSYVGTGWNMLTHTMERRLMLRPLNFTCGCSRCSKFDEGGETCRNLHCPACLTQMTREPGAQLFLSKAATMALQPGGGWKCTKCGVTPSSDDMNDVLGSERAMVERVLGAFFRAPPPSGAKPLSLTSPLELKAKMGIVRRVAESYGQTHYVWVAAVCGLCRALCLFLPHVHENPAVVSSAIASRDPVGSTSFVIAAIVGAVVWFEKNMKGSPQHVRFMTHVCQVRSSFKNYMESPLQLFDDEGDAAAAVALDRVAAKFESTVAKFAAYPDYAAVR